MEYEDNDNNIIKIVYLAQVNGGWVDSWNTDYIDDYNENGYIDLGDLNKRKFDGLPAPPANGIAGDAQDKYEFRFNVMFDSSAPNNYQGDQCILTMDFTMNQDASQLVGLPVSDVPT